MYRYREFGLVTDQDEMQRRAFRDGFKRAGLSFAQLMDALAWYRGSALRTAGEGDLIASFSTFAEERGWPIAQRDAALDVYQAIREKGAEAVADPAPDAVADRAFLARGEQALRGDPAQYWRDAELHDALFEARERLVASDPPGTATSADKANPAASEDRRRIDEIEALLRDPTGAGQRRYWHDQALRDDYARALTRVHGDTGADAVGAPSPPASPASHEESAA
jgi:hypothetical protein